ncbi:unnamed protein product [Caenorhabditis nigoni]
MGVPHIYARLGREMHKAEDRRTIFEKIRAEARNGHLKSKTMNNPVQEEIEHRAVKETAQNDSDGSRATDRSSAEQGVNSIPSSFREKEWQGDE